MKQALNIFYRVIIALAVMLTAAFLVCIPVSLAQELTYQDAAVQAQEIASATAERYLPPGKASRGYGDRQDERRLSEQEIALSQQRLKTVAVEGEQATLPPNPAFPDQNWQLGRPDLILTIPQPYTIAATGSNEYQCFVLPLNLPEDLYVWAIEINPDNSKIVHHAGLYQAPSDRARKLDAQDSDVGYGCSQADGENKVREGFHLWTVGLSPQYLPDGFARLIPKGSDLILENHYHPNGKQETDRSSVGLYLAKTSPQKVAFTIPYGAFNLDIPPGEKHYKATAAIAIPVDLQVIDIMPYMHFLGREMKVTATLPDGTVKPLVWVKDWDFNGKKQNQYEHPVNLPKGTKLEIVAYFDNSSDNPRNPNHPPKRVTWGMTKKDEMASFIITGGVGNNLEELREINQLKEIIRTEVDAALRSRLTRVPFPSKASITLTPDFQQARFFVASNYLGSS